MRYRLTAEDFERAVKFAIHYYLDPTKSTTGRTSAEPRGIGAIMDDFVFGKLIEISVQKILERINNKKEYILDFDIKSTDIVKDEADIVKIKENSVTREPKLFIEIHGADLEQKISNAENIINYLTQNKYSIYHVELREMVYSSNFSIAKSGHIYCF